LDLYIKKNGAGDVEAGDEGENEGVVGGEVEGEGYLEVSVA